MQSVPRVLSSTELSVADAKWVTLKKIKYLDEQGKERLWECAERKTRKSSGVDGVAVLALLRSETNAFPVSTVVIEQYRPPIDKFVIGLVDDNETPEDAAIRELEEETGYKADEVVESSPVIVSDPGMTNANMKLVVLNVVLPDQLETPSQQLQPGEFIVRRVIQLDKLNDKLKGIVPGFIVDARLSHFASGYEMALRLNNGKSA
ncbi:hypothetical protein L208DRAFT_1251613 [Tricholoma matsutake]|nr:hypothetical protein L208DRAFT_1251613 [Tricholoma matsutake 945]